MCWVFFLILFLSLWLADLQYWAVTTKRHSWTEKVRCLPCWRSCGLKMRRSKGWGRTRRTEPASCRTPSSHMSRARVRDPTAAPRNEPERLLPPGWRQTGLIKEEKTAHSQVWLWFMEDMIVITQHKMSWFCIFLNEIVFNIKNIKMKVSFFPLFCPSLVSDISQYQYKETWAVS